MKKTLITLFFAGSLAAFSQNAVKLCGHGEAMEELFRNDPLAKERIEKANAELEKADAEAFKKGYENFRNGLFSNNNDGKLNGTQSTQGVVYNIPVVFHILHQNGTEKISPAQVKDAIDILNRDYNKLNADTADVISQFQNLIGDVEFNFVLAAKDPSGNCTNGIIYHETALTEWTSGTAGPYTGTSAGKWNPSKYLNIYSVNSISSGAAGYTYLPGSFGTGSGNDCIIILHEYIGSIGTGTITRSRALTHEVGHWFNLPHVWGGNNTPGTACGNEGVSDTPITKGYDYCPSSAAASMICNPGIAENYQNYMDYSYCSNMFTVGQATRMRTAITSGAGGRSTLWSPTNLTFTGISNPIPCVPVAFFTTVSNKKNVCSGGTIQFQDSTWNTTVTGWDWSFTGGTPSTSSDSMPIITYNTPGIYPVSYTATTSAGNGTHTKTGFITVTSSTATYQNALIEGFESITVPNTDWTVDNAGVVDWEQDNTVGSTGTNCMKINNINNTDGAVEVLYTPSYNISAINSANPTITFTFKLAHQRATTAASEKLQVFSSSNCGYSWSQRYSKAGSALATVATASTSPFVPTTGQWRTETVSISALLAQQNVWFKFVFTADAAGNTNNIYIDDINISNNSVGLYDVLESTLSYNVFPNPSTGNMNVSFSLDSKRNVKLELVDLLGKTIETATSSNLQAGDYEFNFGKNTKLAAGIYISKLTIDGKTYSQKVIVE
jgi:PKD repeat protein